MITRIRRFTVVSAGCDGEGVQFSGGLVVVLWGEGNDTIDSYDDLAAYERLWPHHVITWIDDQPKEDTQGVALRRTYGEDRHIVDLRDRGWTIQHPLSCRPNLFDCPINRAAERDLVARPAAFGRLECGVNDAGQFVIYGPEGHCTQAARDQP